MTLLTMPVTASHSKLVSTAAPKMYILDMKPTVGGTPIREIIENPKTPAKNGARLAMPANESIRSELIRLDMAMTAENAARLVIA